MRNWVKGKVRQLFLMLSNRRKSILKWFLILGGVILSSYVFGFSINCFIAAGFHLKISARLLFDGKTFLYSGVLCGLFLFFALYYYYTHYWIFNSKNIIKGKERDKHITANLEQARFETETEIAKNFQTVYYDELPETEVKGIPIIAYEEKHRLKVTFRHLHMR